MVAVVVVRLLMRLSIACWHDLAYEDTWAVTLPRFTFHVSHTHYVRTYKERFGMNINRHSALIFTDMVVQQQV